MSNIFMLFALVLCTLAVVMSVETTVVNLATAGNYAILTKTGISTVPSSAITGDIAVSPIAAAAMTGFDPLTLESGGKYATASQFTGKAYAASYGGSIETALTAAVSAMEAAYTDAKGRVNTDAARINLGAGILGGALLGGPNAPLTPGVYTFSTSVSITGNLHFSGSATDIFIIQVAGNVIMSANYKVLLQSVQGAALAKNIFWAVAGDVKVAAGAHMEGILLVASRVDFITGSSLNGRVLAQTFCALQKATIVEPST
jgi:hypothetical protein